MSHRTEPVQDTAAAELAAMAPAEPVEGVVHSAEAAQPDPALEQAVDAALEDARALRDAQLATAEAEAKTEGAVVTEAPPEPAAEPAPAAVVEEPQTIDSLDASLAAAAEEAAQRLEAEGAAPLPEPAPKPAAPAPVAEGGAAPQGEVATAPAPAAAPAGSASEPAEAESDAAAAAAASGGALAAAWETAVAALGELSQRVERLSPTARHTLSWAAALTAANAAAVWTVVLFTSWGSGEAVEQKDAAAEAPTREAAPASAPAAAGAGERR